MEINADFSRRAAIVPKSESVAHDEAAADHAISYFIVGS
jgi:hypothetical protein